MISIDIEMPESCEKCQFRSTEPNSYCTFFCTAINGTVKYPDYKESRVPCCPLRTLISAEFIEKYIKK